MTNFFDQFDQTGNFFDEFDEEPQPLPDTPPATSPAPVPRPSASPAAVQGFNGLAEPDMPDELPPVDKAPPPRLLQAVRPEPLASTPAPVSEATRKRTVGRIAQIEAYLSDPKLSDSLRTFYQGRLEGLRASDPDSAGMNEVEQMYRDTAVPARIGAREPEQPAELEPEPVAPTAPPGDEWEGREPFDIDRQRAAYSQIQSTPRDEPPVDTTNYMPTDEAILTELGNTPERIEKGFLGNALQRAEQAIIDGLGQAGFAKNVEAELSEVRDQLAVARRGLNSGSAMDMAPMLAEISHLENREALLDRIYRTPGHADKLLEKAREKVLTAQRRRAGLQGSIDELEAAIKPTNPAPGWDQALVSGISSFGDMAPGLVTTVVAKNPIPMMAYLTAYSRGSSYVDKRAEGYDSQKAATAANLYAAAETIPEIVPLSRILREGSGFLRKATEGALTEAPSEVLTQFLQQAVDTGVLDEDMTWGEAVAEMTQAGQAGLVMGGMMGAGAGAISGARDRLADRRARKGTPADPNAYAFPGQDLLTEADKASIIPDDAQGPGKKLLAEIEAGKNTPQTRAPAGPNLGVPPLDEAAANVQPPATETPVQTEGQRPTKPVTPAQPSTPPDIDDGPAPLQPAQLAAGQRVEVSLTGGEPITATVESTNRAGPVLVDEDGERIQVPVEDIEDGTTTLRTAPERASEAAPAPAAAPAAPAPPEAPDAAPAPAESVSRETPDAPAPVESVPPAAAPVVEDVPPGGDRAAAGVRRSDVPVKRPVTHALRGFKVHPDSRFAVELNHNGINAQTHPGMFDRRGHTGDGDNFPAQEFQDIRNLVGEDGNGYLSRDGLIETLVSEMQAVAQGRDPQTLYLAERAAAAENAEQARNRFQSDPAPDPEPLDLSAYEGAQTVTPQTEAEAFDAAERVAAVNRDIDAALAETRMDKSITPAERAELFRAVNENGGSAEDVLWGIIHRSADRADTTTDAEFNAVEDIPWAPVGREEAGSRDTAGAVQEGAGQPEGGRPAESRGQARNEDAAGDAAGTAQGGVDGPAAVQPDVRGAGRTAPRAKDGTGASARPADQSGNDRGPDGAVGDVRPVRTEGSEATQDVAPTTLEAVADKSKRSHVYAEFGGGRYFIQSYDSKDQGNARQQYETLANDSGVSVFVVDRADGTSINGTEADLKAAVKKARQKRANRGGLFDAESTPEGEQTVIPGTRDDQGRDTSRDKAEVDARSKQSKKGTTVEQTDAGPLFGDEGGTQGNLLKEQRLGSDIFYSPLLRALENAKQNTALASDWKAIIAKMPGVKKAEIDWLGINDWLDSQEGQQVPREAVIEFVQSSQIVLVEDQLGGFVSSGSFVVEYPSGGIYSDQGDPVIVTTTENPNAVFEGWIDESGQAYFPALGDYGTDGEYFSPESAYSDMADALNQESPPNHESYTEPGGENYREILLRVPDLHKEGPNSSGRNVELDGFGRNTSLAKKPFVQSSHFDQENIVVHARVKDRKGAKGEKVLFVEEIQSDLASKWRESTESSEVTARRRELQKRLDETADARLILTGKVGTALSEYFTKENISEPAKAARKTVYNIEDRVNGHRDELAASTKYADALMEIDHALYLEVLDAMRERKSVHQELIALGTERSVDPSLPDTPFKEEHTYTLMVKRLLREAAEAGYDKLSWTPGYMQAERWNNAAQSVVEGVEWKPAPENQRENGATRLIKLNMDGRGKYVLWTDRAGKITDTSEEISQARGKPLSALIGPNLATQVLSEDTGSVTGQKITFPDSGYAIAYDQQIKRAVDKFAKKYGSRVQVDKTLPDFQGTYVGKSEADVRDDPLPVWSIDITPELREAAMQPMSLLQKPVFNIDPAPAVDPTKIAPIMADLRTRLDKMALKQVNLSYDPSLESQAAFGSDSKGNMHILIGAASRDEVRSLGHEAVHALNAMDLFTKKEWAALTAEAERIWMRKYKIADRYSDLSKAEQIEEAIAEAFGEYSGRAPNNLIQSAFAKIKRFFKALGEALGAANVTSVEDVFADVAEGRVGRRTGAVAGNAVQRDRRNAEVIIPEDVDAAVDDLSELAGMIFDEIVREPGLLARQVAERVYQHRDDGGPLDARGVVKVKVNQINAAIRPLGYEIAGRVGGRLGYRLLPLEGPAREVIEGRVGSQPRTRTKEQRLPSGYTSDDLQRIAASNALTGQPITPTQPMLPPGFPAPRRTGLMKFRETWQDRILYQRAAEQLLEKTTGTPLADKDSPSSRETTYYGRVATRLEKMRMDESLPLAEAMANEGVDVGQVGLFMLARHAPERNAEMQRRDPALFAQGGGSGMTDATAAAELQRFASMGLTQKLEKIAGMVETILKRDLQHRRASGLLTNAAYQRATSMYQHYVPLRGFAEREDGDQIGKFGIGFDIRGKELQSALGRKSISDNPVTQAIAMRQEGIVRAEKERVGRAYLSLAQKHPHPELWEVMGKLPMRKILDPATGTVKRIVDFGAVREDEVLGVKVGGNQVYVRINDPFLASQIKNLDQTSTTQLEKAVMSLRRVTVAFSRLQTSLNPDFTVPNAVADAFEGIWTAYNVKDTKGMIRSFAKHYPIALYQGISEEVETSALGRKIAGTAQKKIQRLAANSITPQQMGKYKAYREEWEAAGGKINFMAFRDADEITRDIYRDIRKANKNWMLPNPVSMAEGALKAVEKINQPVESAARLAMYMAAREQGLSREKAAALSLDASGNYYRRGSAGKYAAAAYAFFGPAVQGIEKMARFGLRPRNVPIIGGIVLGNYFLGQMFREMYPDDDDPEGRSLYDQIPVFERARGIPIPTGIIYDEITMPDGTTVEKPRLDYFTMRVPHNLRPFLMLGDQMSALEHAKQHGGPTLHTTPESATREVSRSIAMNTNPLSGETAWNMIAPTVLDPLVDISQNRNFFGGGIAPDEQPWTKGRPQSDQYREGRTSPAAAWAAEQLSEAPWGLFGIERESTLKPGHIDVYPATLEYLFNYSAGGLGRFVSRSAEAALNVSQGVETEPHRKPVLRSFAGQTNRFAESGRYYDTRNRINEMKNQLTGGKDRMEADPGNAEIREDFEDLLKEMNATWNGKNFGWTESTWKMFDKAQDELNERYAEIDAIRTNKTLERPERIERIRAIEGQIEIMQRETYKDYIELMERIAQNGGLP